MHLEKGVSGIYTLSFAPKHVYNCPLLRSQTEWLETGFILSPLIFVASDNHYLGADSATIQHSLRLLIDYCRPGFQQQLQCGFGQVWNLMGIKHGRASRFHYFGHLETGDKYRVLSLTLRAIAQAQKFNHWAKESTLMSGCSSCSGTNIKQRACQGLLCQSLH